MNSKQTIELVDIQIRKENEAYIVENMVTGDFYEMNEVSIQALHYLRAKGTDSLEMIEQLLRERFPNEEINMVDFVRTLEDFGFIKGEEVKTNQSVHSIRKSIVNNVPITLGKLFFNKLTICIYIIISCINLTLFISDTTLIPHYTDFFIFQSITYNLLTWLIVSLLIIIIHEFGHILATRSYGLLTRLTIGHRLFFVVFETDLSFVWRLEKKDRSVIYLAGLFFDNMVLFLSLLGQSFFPEATFANLLCKLLVVQILINIIYQFCIFMKTDLYYLLENMTGFYNLQTAANQHILSLVTLRKVVKTDKVDAKKYYIYLYEIFYICGVVGITSIFFVLTLPQMYVALSDSLHKMIAPATTMHFWDGTLFIAQTVIMLVLLMYSWFKKLINWKS